MNDDLNEKGIQNAMAPIVHIVYLTARKTISQDLHKITLASSICCCSITCHFELGRHKSKLFSTFSTNGNVPNNTSSFYLHLLKVALKNYLICSLTLQCWYIEPRTREKSLN